MACVRASLDRTTHWVGRTTLTQSSRAPPTRSNRGLAVVSRWTEATPLHTFSGKSLVYAQGLRYAPSRELLFAKNGLGWPLRAIWGAFRVFTPAQRRSPELHASSSETPQMGHNAAVHRDEGVPP